MKHGVNILNDNLTILVVGFDGYHDVWNHFFELINKNWPDRPRTILADNELTPHYVGVEVISAGKDAEWSKKVQVALEQINTPYVLLLLEDFFIAEPVNNNVINETLHLISENDIWFYQVLVQLLNQKQIKGAPYKGNKNIHIVPSDKKYGINLQAAIWKTEFLKKKVGTENYNAWQFEIRQLGTENYNIKGIHYLIDDRNILNIEHAVVQSKYLPGTLKRLDKLGYRIDRNERQMLSTKQNFDYNLKLFMYAHTPKKLIGTFKKIGRVFKVDFVTDRMSK